MEYDIKIKEDDNRFKDDGQHDIKMEDENRFKKDYGEHNTIRGVSESQKTVIVNLLKRKDIPHTVKEGGSHVWCECGNDEHEIYYRIKRPDKDPIPYEEPVLYTIIKCTKCGKETKFKPMFADESGYEEI